jgi:hypothetical protein
VQPYAARPALPELYEAKSRSNEITSAAVTQIIKTTASTEAKSAWDELIEHIEKSKAVGVKSWHGLGIEEKEGTFLGLIGWASLEVS